MLRIVSKINDIYNSLASVSNDDLRNRIRQIELSIDEAGDPNAALNNVLSEVFAVVKETARRFSLGDIEVTANDNDKKLANKYDFVFIRGTKAVYKNQWTVGRIRYIWNMIHYDEQILGGIYLHCGNAIEMATGEGKTLVATLPVFLNALTHKGVHLMTVNNYLSKRDYEITRPIYMFYGLTVDCIENYARGTSEHKNAYSADIVCGANSSFVFDYLFDHIALDKLACTNENQNFAIIDEIDSILIDEADTPHIVSGGSLYSDEQIFKQYLPIVKELIDANDGTLFTVNTQSRDVILSKDGEKWICNRLNKPMLYEAYKTYEFPNFNSLCQSRKDEILDHIKIQNVIRQLLLAITVFEKDVDYIVQSNRVKIIDQNTGRIKATQRWEHGLHTAMEVKEGVTVQSDSDAMAVISLKNYFKLYEKICGMSGTIMDVSDEIKEIYGMNCVKIRTHKPVCREDVPLQIYRTEEKKDTAILNLIKNNVVCGRPTLIGCKSIKRANAIEYQLKNASLSFYRLDATSTHEEAIIISKAGIANTITLSTAVAGRGTDIKLSDDAIAKGGLCVIGTDMFGSKRTILQLRGRSGRQGDPGKSMFFASLEDELLCYLSKTEHNKLQELAATVCGDNLSEDNIREYFQIAQNRRELIYRQRRKKLSQKDDLIAPHRAKFYEQRNALLISTSNVDKIISELMHTTITAVDVALLSHYSTVTEILRRIKSNNVNAVKAYVPFSYNQHPFVIQFDINEALRNKCYYIQEFKRQCILQTYDIFWKDFVVYLMGDLDHYEIDKLNDVYAKMCNDINASISGRLLNARLIFNISNGPQNDTTPPIKIETPEPSQSRNESMCPCGSGKIFGKCHGANIFRRVRRIY
jgi:preprotein translocase subunit SecA